MRCKRIITAMLATCLLSALFGCSHDAAGTAQRTLRLGPRDDPGGVWLLSAREPIPTARRPPQSVVVRTVCESQRQISWFVSPSIIGPNVQAVFRITGLQHVPGKPDVARIVFRYDRFQSNPFEIGRESRFLFDGRGKCVSIWASPAGFPASGKAIHAYRSE